VKTSKVRRRQWKRYLRYLDRLPCSKVLTPWGYSRRVLNVELNKLQKRASEANIDKLLNMLHKVYDQAVARLSN
jgi:hypothetical protein